MRVPVNSGSTPPALMSSLLSHGASDDGGRDEFDESTASRRSNSSIRSPCAAITRACSALRSDSSFTSANNRSWVQASGTTNTLPDSDRRSSRHARPVTQPHQPQTAQVNSYQQ
jgi:hypothetical protein